MKVINSVFEREEAKYTNMLNEAKKYGTETVTVNGKKTRGYLFGNDEMFEGNNFYQLFAVYGSSKIYKAYYNVRDFRSLEDMDYTKPYKTQLSQLYVK